MLKKLAEENLSKAGGDQKSGLPKSSKAIDKKIHVRDELAKIAGVGHDTYGKAKKESTQCVSLKISSWRSIFLFRYNYGIYCNILSNKIESIVTTQYNL